MCLTFFYMNPNENESEFRFILVFNRDEFFSRPTFPASWSEGSSSSSSSSSVSASVPPCLAGRDGAEGKRGGTWLAINRNAKLALLTNVYTGQPQKGEGEGRGFIVLDYINSHLRPEEYLNTIKQSGKDYSPFNVCVFDFTSGDHVQSLGYTRSRKGSPVESEGPVFLPPGCHGLSNHPFSSPYQKTIHGKKIFQDIVRDFNRVDGGDVLEKKLFDLMSVQGSHLPDPQMERQGGSSQFKAFHDKLSSIFVDMPLQKYGTRMQTLILVDFFGQVTYVERTRDSPETKPISWSEKRYTFSFKSS